MTRKKILFFAHAVTIAHMTRPLSWIKNLDPDVYDIYLASRASLKSMCPLYVTFIEAENIDPDQFSKTVDKAGVIYDEKTFEDHIADDLRILEKIKPDLVIGDFRHSLSVSCRLLKIKYVNITNAYWSPNIKNPFPLPEIPVVRMLGETLAKILIGPFVPIAVKISFFKMAFALRKSLKKANLNFTDYRQVITDGDVTVFCDKAELVPLKKLLPHEKYVGPILWSAPMAVPDWWSNLKTNRKHVFLSLGSSGDASLLPMIVNALLPYNVEIIIALAGKKVDLPESTRVHVADYLPLPEILKKASLVICNGGSPMCHAALAYGAPTVGIVFNNDQLLNMTHVQKRQAGILLRYWNITESKIKEAVSEILSDTKYRLAAEKIKDEFTENDVSKTLLNLISENV